MNAEIRIIAGLGNHSQKYNKTRHNSGVLLLEELAGFLNIELNQTWPSWEGGSRILNKEESFFGQQCPPTDIKLHLIRLKSYMNLSGRPIAEALKYWRVKAEQILVLHDEIDLPFGELRFKEGGGHRGHNGLRDIVHFIGADFSRLRIGIGRPKHESDVADYVLSDFSRDEQKKLPKIWEESHEFCLDWLRHARS